MSPLIPPDAMPAIPQVQLPYEVYWVVQEPAPLAGMPMPSPRTPWSAFAAAGFSHVVCLTDAVPRYDPAPLSVIHAVELEDLVFGDPPKEPMAEEQRIREAVSVVVQHVQAGTGVMVHCYGGRGRAGTVIGCTLRVLGYTGAEVCAYLNQVHQARWKAGWPEAAWQAELVNRFC